MNRLPTFVSFVGLVLALSACSGLPDVLRTARDVCAIVGAVPADQAEALRAAVEAQTDDEQIRALLQGADTARILVCRAVEGAP